MYVYSVWCLVIGLSVCVCVCVSLQPLAPRSVLARLTEPWPLHVWQENKSVSGSESVVCRSPWVLHNLIISWAFAPYLKCGLLLLCVYLVLPLVQECMWEKQCGRKCWWHIGRLPSSDCGISVLNTVIYGRCGSVLAWADAKGCVLDQQYPLAVNLRIRNHPGRAGEGAWEKKQLSVLITGSLFLFSAFPPCTFLPLQHTWLLFNYI